MQATDVLQVGDVVELIRLPLGRTRTLRVGQQGTVLVANDQIFAWVTVQFQGHQRPHLLRPAHLRRVENDQGEGATDGD
jgi:hypothetical protein